MATAERHDLSALKFTVHLRGVEGDAWALRARGGLTAAQIDRFLAFPLAGQLHRKRFADRATSILWQHCSILVQIEWHRCGRDQALDVTPLPVRQANRGAPGRLGP